MKCRKCQFDNPSDSKFCKECGTELIVDEDIPAHTKTLQTPSRETIKDVKVGEIIDEKYKLIEELGSGGMGVVYKAEQLKPIKRSVAVKVIKLGMDTKEVVARFETEKQALAVMKHPNISKVIDAGATEKGRPYFVMELVSGIPITDYCDKHKLTTKERLELIIPVCEAVQHAHQKGVIHRDLKPSNVLVEIQEDKPVPKIIDFGIAKATEHRLTERTLFTEQGQLVGTPEYMSPEQAEMSGLDVDTRTDIYSLGVMLYELLVGTLPFDSETFRKAGFGEIQRIIRETDPPKASTRLSDLGDTQTSIAERRKTDVASLQKQLKGDLDWITMKAMEKDRTRRYSTALELTADITRHLNREPIIARPPSAIYNMGRFVKRHKLGVTAAALVIIAIMIGGIAASIGFMRATRAEQLTRKEAETAKQVSDFLINLFEVSDPGEARGNKITAREILDKGSEDIEKTLEDQPEIQARLMGIMGDVYTKLGLYNKAESILMPAYKAKQQMLGKEHPDTLKTMNDLAAVYYFQDRFEDAEQMYMELIEYRRRLLGDEHPKTLQAKFALGSVYAYTNRQDEMERLTLEVLAAQKRILGEEHPDALASMHNLAWVYQAQKRYDEAEAMWKKVFEISLKTQGEDHPETISAYGSLGVLYYLKGQYEKAEPILIETAEAMHKLYGEFSQDMYASLRVLHLIYLKQGLYDEAENRLLSAYQMSSSAYGKDDWLVQQFIRDLIALYETWGKPEKTSQYRALLKDGVKE